MTIAAFILALLPACATEDSSWCVWDAQARGNGQGRSFIALEHSVIYTQPETKP